jgi:NAD dependent epimerase/dehydratase family enzyme
LPNLPGFFLKLALGKMASVVLDGLKADNAFIQSKGFVFNDSDLKEAITKIYA